MLLLEVLEAFNGPDQQLQELGVIGPTETSDHKTGKGRVVDNNILRLIRRNGRRCPSTESQTPPAESLFCRRSRFTSRDDRSLPRALTFNCLPDWLSLRHTFLLLRWFVLFRQRWTSMGFKCIKTGSKRKTLRDRETLEFSLKWLLA